MRILESEQAVTLHPGALQGARMYRALTQLDLALKAGISRQQLNKLERGEVERPTAQTVHELANALDVPASYLATPPSKVPPADVLHFRGKMRRPPKVVEQLQIKGEHFGRTVAYLETHVHLPEVHIPEHVAPSVAAIERAAEACRIDWGLRTDNPIANMTRLLERAGAVVGLFRLEDDSVEAFSWWRERPLVMSKRGGESATRRRWSLAHELGHLVMHRRVATGEHATETEAHRFASAFLMPERAFRIEFPRRSRIDWDGLIEMKQRWGTSVQAILHRAHDLGVITSAAYRSAYVRISQLGWRRSEPAEPEFESPELVPNVVASLRAQGLSEHTIATRIGFDVRLLEDAVGVTLRERPQANTELAGAIIELRNWRDRNVRVNS
jgi:Zn-dependent peptidase ImmA (M78 family)/transcriptional regulator with XRE-family HTH domain